MPSGENWQKGLGTSETMIAELSGISKRQPSEKCWDRGVGKSIPSPGNGMNRGLKACKNEVSSENSRYDSLLVGMQSDDRVA